MLFIVIDDVLDRPVPIVLSLCCLALGDPRRTIVSFGYLSVRTAEWPLLFLRFFIYAENKIYLSGYQKY